jgi:phospholipid/cholesterol/gamma-HCH transport system substrate-binding protein
MPSESRVRWAKIRAVAVALAALAILGTLTYLLSGGTLFERKATVYLYIPDATGIGAESPVRVDGIGVGKVENVFLSGSTDPKRVVRVVMQLERSALPRIPADSSVQLSSETLIGDKYVDISTGRSLDHVQPGGEIAYREQTDFMKNLDLQQFETSLRTVDVMLTDIEQGKSRVGQFVLGDAMYNDIRSNIRKFDESLRNAVNTTNAVGRDVYTAEVYNRIRTPIVELDRSLARLQSGQGTAGQLLRDTASYEQARALVQDVQRSVRDIHSSEFVQSDVMYEDWSRLASSLILKVDEFNAGSWFGTTANYDNLTGSMKEMAEQVKAFREDPKKFLRLKVF